MRTAPGYLQFQRSTKLNFIHTKSETGETEIIINACRLKRLVAALNVRQISSAASKGSKLMSIINTVTKYILGL